MDGTGVGAHMFIKACGFYPCLLGIKARNKFSAVNLDDSEFLDTYSSLISEKKTPDKQTLTPVLYRIQFKQVRRFILGVVVLATHSISFN